MNEHDYVLSMMLVFNEMYQTGQLWARRTQLPESAGVKKCQFTLNDCNEICCTITDLHSKI